MWTITNISMLWGLLAVGVVIALHLWRRRRSTKILRFTGVSMLQTIDVRKRDTQLRDRVLLFLRAVVVGLIVVAFAGLDWRDSGQADISHPGPRDVAGTIDDADAETCVVVLDASASMTRVVDGVNWFESAKELARRAIDQSRARNVRVVVAGGGWRGQAPDVAWELGANGPMRAEGALPAAQQSLKLAIDRVEAGTSDSHAAAAMSIARRLAGERGRVVVVSDLQTTDWARQRGVSSSNIAWIPVTASRDGENLGITGASILSGRPVADAHADWVVTIENRSGRPRAVDVQLEVDGKVSGTQSVAAEPWGRGDALFSFNWGPSGTRRIVNRITNLDDALTADNFAAWQINIADRPRVLLVSDETREPGTGDYFWARALESGGRFEITSIWSSELSAIEWEKFDAIVLGHIETLTISNARKLVGFLQQEKSIVWIAGDDGAMPRWRVLMEAMKDQAEKSPWEWQRSIETGSDSASSVVATDHTVINPWMGTKIVRRWQFEQTLPSSEKFPFEYEDRQPLVWTWQPLNSGKIVVANLGADPHWSNASGNAVFAVFAHLLIAQATPGRSAMRSAYLVPAAEGDLRNLSIHDFFAASIEQMQKDRIISSEDRTHHAWPVALSAAMALLILEAWLARPRGRHA